MSLKMNCPRCGQRVGAEDEMIGDRVPCPNCGEKFSVTHPDEEPVEQEEIVLGPDAGTGPETEGQAQDATGPESEEELKSRTDESEPKMGTFRRRFNTIAGAFFAILMLIILVNHAVDWISKLGPPKDLKGVTKRIAGSDYVSERFALSPPNGLYCYARFEFDKDGTVKAWLQHVTADQWGEPARGTWEPIADKYSDTGEPYFGVRIEIDPSPGRPNDSLGDSQFADRLYRTDIVFRENELLLYLDPWRVPSTTLTRGHKEPFHTVPD